MTTLPLYRSDPYATFAQSRVLALTAEGGIVPEASLFYPAGGGQPGDSGRIDWDGGTIGIATAVKGDGGAVVLVPAAPAALPPPGAAIAQRIDWPRRHLHMRIHTALHLLSVVLPHPVTGGQVGAGTGRLDFAMDGAPPDRAAIEEALNALVDRDLAVGEEWIDEAALAASPGLVKTLRVAPPQGQGRVRLIRIGAGDETVDLQPCGGTHVARTGEIGRLVVTRIESKGRQNRRVAIALDA